MVVMSTGIDNMENNSARTWYDYHGNSTAGNSANYFAQMPYQYNMNHTGKQILTYKTQLLIFFFCFKAQVFLFNCFNA